jgi:(1->4)-alpha-D-glucan 1-alpha-D-glucosylmutase
LFWRGDYVPVQASGSHSKHVLAFVRRLGSSQIIVVVPRLCARLLAAEIRLPVSESVWGNTAIQVPGPGKPSFRNVLTGEMLSARHEDGNLELSLASVLGEFPIAVLNQQL